MKHNYQLIIKHIAEKFIRALNYIKGNADTIIKLLKENDLITE